MVWKFHRQFQKWEMEGNYVNAFENYLIQLLFFRYGIVSPDSSVSEFPLLYFAFIFLEMKDKSLWILIVLSLEPNFAISGLSFVLPSCL